MLQPCSSVKALLGEGPHWDPSTGCLWFVDITGQRIFCYNPATEQTESFRFEDTVSTWVPRAQGGAVLTLGRRFCAWDWQTGQLNPLAEVEPDLPNNRFNDGKCDAKGRFWAGTLDKGESEPLGALYCLDVDLSVRKVLDGVTVSNGLGWSPDNRTMYYIDTPTHLVFAFDFDLDRGTLSNRREILRIDQGMPDGMTVDAEGMLWIAHWGGARVSRWDPMRATLLEEHPLPVDRVTSLAFGGPELTQLFVTTARQGLPSETAGRQPFAGHLFTMTTSVPGLLAYSFGG